MDIKNSIYGNTPWTENTIEVRKFLEKNKFHPLTFFEGGDYVYAFLTTRANKNDQWVEKDYSTFNINEKGSMSFLNEEKSTVADFKIFIENINTSLLY